MVEDNPLDLENIKERQDEDDRLIQSTVKHPTWYSRKTINDVEDILCYTKPGANAANWRIALPEDLILLLLSGTIRLLVTQVARDSMNS